MLGGTADAIAVVSSVLVAGGDRGRGFRVRAEQARPAGARRRGGRGGRGVRRVRQGLLGAVRRLARAARPARRPRGGRDGGRRARADAARVLASHGHPDGRRQRLAPARTRHLCRVPDGSLALDWVTFGRRAFLQVGGGASGRSAGRRRRQATETEGRAGFGRRPRANRARLGARGRWQGGRATGRARDRSTTRRSRTSSGVKPRRSSSSALRCCQATACCCPFQ